MRNKGLLQTKGYVLIVLPRIIPRGNVAQKVDALCVHKGIMHCFIRKMLRIVTPLHLKCIRMDSILNLQECPIRTLITFKPRYFPDNSKVLGLSTKIQIPLTTLCMIMFPTPTHYICLPFPPAPHTCYWLRQ